jgi:hypothetical protein
LLAVLNAGNCHKKKLKSKLSPEEEVRILQQQIEVTGDGIWHVLFSQICSHQSVF